MSNSTLDLPEYTSPRDSLTHPRSVRSRRVRSVAGKTPRFALVLFTLAAASLFSTFAVAPLGSTGVERHLFLSLTLVFSALGMRAASSSIPSRSR